MKYLLISDFLVGVAGLRVTGRKERRRAFRCCTMSVKKKGAHVLKSNALRLKRGLIC
jgi:hypothetical protein